MQHYPEYRESGVEWIGEIPKDWDTIRCAHLFEVKHIKKTSEEINLSVYRDYGVIKRDSRDDNYNRVSEDTSNYKLVEPGDFVFNKMKCWQGSLGVSEYRGIVSPAYTVCKPKRHFHGQYFHYLLRSQLCIQEFSRLSCGVRPGQWELRFKDFKDIVVPYPSMLEQTQIAAFLDHKTEKINELIHIKERQVELLHEYRASLINQTVTKGLDPNVKMKSSGIEWIGDICSHWQVKKLKYIVRGGLTNGIFKKRDQFGSGVKLINVTDIYQDDFLVKFEELDRVKAEPHEIETYAVEQGDIFFVRSSLKLEGVAASACVTDVPEPTVFECHLVRLQPCPTQVLFKYLINYLNSIQTRQRLITLANTVTMTTIAQPRLASIEVTLPPLSEQAQIVEFLDRKTGQIDKLIAIEGRRIELLKEYRQSLISHVVTGKIDVRQGLSISCVCSRDL